MTGSGWTIWPKYWLDRTGALECLFKIFAVHPGRFGAAHMHHDDGTFQAADFLAAALALGLQARDLTRLYPHLERLA